MTGTVHRPLELTDPLPTPESVVPPVDLEQLGRCLVDDLDVTLASDGRPVTFEPSHASRDPERWTALGTFGHPALAPALDRLAESDLPASGAANDALLIPELGGRAIAYRADRTPPQRVRCIDDLLDLGPPLAAGDAETVTRHKLDAEVAAIQGRVRELAAARLERTVRDIRSRFKILVARAVRAEQVLRRREDGEAPTASLVWLDLTQDPSGWQHAAEFPAHLGLTPEEVLPRGGPGADDRRDRELRAVRTQTGKQVVDLIKEFIAIQRAGSS